MDSALAAAGVCSGAPDSEASRYSVAAGTLDPPTGLSTVHALFVADASDYHRLDPDLPHHLHDSGTDGVPMEGSW